MLKIAFLISDFGYLQKLPSGLLWSVFFGRFKPLTLRPLCPHEPLSVIDTSLDATSEPLIEVRLNHHLSRRLRWLIRRGRVSRSGEVRLATTEDTALCNLTPGQFMEYSIRVHRMSRIRIYGMGLGRRTLRLRAIFWAALQGDALSMRKAGNCAALLSPD